MQHAEASGSGQKVTADKASESSRPGRARSVPEQAVKEGLQRSLADSASGGQAGPEQVDHLPETTFQAAGHGLPELQFQLQFTAVQRRPGKIARRHWSSLDRSGRPRPELLMRLGSPGLRKVRLVAVAPGALP